MSTLPSLEQLHAIGAKQQPSYDDPAALAAVVDRLRTLPPLVFAGECDEFEGQDRRGQPRRGLPAPGRGLRGDLRRRDRRQHPQQACGCYCRWRSC
ncbi:3-deoxy-7-phosphoheptulonate synthase [Nocardioides convexus]|uniref:3-deoxy-7-phosphoheptulonate synthase n=1 Tax=Nocardioides convexus TaxID=2712224 RepID=UPI003101A926